MRLSHKFKRGVKINYIKFACWRIKTNMQGRMGSIL